MKSKCLYMFLVCLASLFLISSSLNILPIIKVNAQSTPIMSVEPPHTAPLPGETFQVDINITYVEYLYGYEFRLFYNMYVITAIDLEPGAASTNDTGFFFTGKGYKVWKYEINNNDPYGNGTGYAWLAVTRPLGVPEGLSGSGRLARITFSADSLGISALTFSLHVTGDPMGPIEHRVTEGMVVVDNTPPTIGTPLQVPDGNSLPEQEVEVSVSAIDTISGVKNVTLLYTIDEGIIWTNLQMSHNSTTDLYEATIPAQPVGTQVKYKISAYDNAGNQALSDNAGQYYVYMVVPEIPPALLLPLFIILTAIAATLLRKKTKHGH